MVVDEAILWSSLVLLATGISLHRMGPSFQRSRFGSPLALLGVASFVLLPEKLDDPESEVYGSIIALVKWTVPVCLGCDSRPEGLFDVWRAILFWSASRMGSNRHLMDNCLF
ncbi:MAG: hypothetical protein CM15mP105_1360 [Methanobacteriota archaeon]|nr:MAG: hypothetical protein CM15mP105_1360 [Euryarchaeota archaeon]